MPPGIRCAASSGSATAAPEAARPRTLSFSQTQPLATISWGRPPSPCQPSRCVHAQEKRMLHQWWAQCSLPPTATPTPPAPRCADRLLLPVHVYEYHRQRHRRHNCPGVRGLHRPLGQQPGLDQPLHRRQRRAHAAASQRPAAGSGACSEPAPTRPASPGRQPTGGDTAAITCISTAADATHARAACAGHGSQPADRGAIASQPRSSAYSRANSRPFTAAAAAAAARPGVVGVQRTS